MSNTNIEDVMVQLTETRNELSEEDLRLWDGLENERVSRIAGDDANKSLTLQVQDSVSGTERRLSTEVIHREQGDLDKLGLLNQLSQSMSAYRIKTDKEIEAERFARDILGINLDARITTAEASFNHKELKLYQDIQEVFTDLDGKYTSMDARIKKYEDMLQDITMDSIKITMDNGEINMGAWTILSQAREWDLEILAKMRGFQEKTNEDVNQALEELQNQLPITENIINEIMENLSESPLIAELRDALNESIDTTGGLELKLAQEAADRAREMIELAYANAQALAAEKAALAESLAAEAQARADEVQEEANRRIESIRQIREDIGQEVDLINGQIATDIGLIKTELKDAKDGFNSSIEEVRGETDVVLNELTTYKASNDVAIAGLVSKVNTNVTNTAANASKIEGLTSELATTNTELGKVRNTSATALSKADTAVSANSALANRVDALAAAITDLGEGAETTVDVYAFNALKAEVETNASGVSSLVEQVNALGTNYSNLEDGLTANTEAVSSLVVKQNEMNGDISQLASDVTYLTSELGELDAAIDANVSAISNTNTELSKVNGKITAANEAATLLSGRVSNVEGEITKKADASALSSLTTRVGTVEGQYTSQASDITQLSNSLDTTNLNVGTAQTAAQNAMTAAGAKGKVVFGNTPPTVADRLVQNLWIDTTGNANTPKRWNGSAWVAVTDKVAMDAANAVSALDTVVKTKADVSALNSLTTKVTDEANKTVANTNSITELNSDIVKINNDLATKASASALNDIYTKTQTDAKAIEIAAGEVNKYDARLVIGGTNFLRNGNFADDLTIWSRYGSIVNITFPLVNGKKYARIVNTETGVYFKGITQTVSAAPFSKGEDFVISFEAFTDLEALQSIYLLIHQVGGGNNEPQLSKVITLSKTATRYEAAFKVTSSKIVTVFNVMFHTTPNQASDIHITDVMLQKGTRATAYVDSTEDIQESLDANATAISSTNTEVSRVEGKTNVNADNISGLTSRMGTVEGQVSTKAEASALQNYYTKTEAAANATTVAAGEVSKYDASLVIGGTNLFSIVDSVAGFPTSGTGDIVLSTASHLAMQTLVPIGTHKHLVYQVWNPSSISNTGNTNRLAFFKADRSFLSLYAIPQLNGTPYQTSLIPIPEEAAYVRLAAIVGPHNAARDTSIKVKFEFGNKATDWAPSNEEVQSSLDANATAISNTNAEVRRVDGRVTTESNRITTLSGRVSTVEGGLATKADVTALNNVYTKTESDAKATSLAAGEISKYDASLTVGGTNHIKNGNFEKGLDSWGNFGGNSATRTFETINNKVYLRMRATDSVVFRGVNQGFNAASFNGGDSVVISFEAFTVSNDPQQARVLVHQTNNGDNNPQISSIIALSKTPTRYSFTFTVTNSKVVNTFTLMLFGNISAPFDIHITEVMFQKGNKATSWMPSDAEVQSEITANAEALNTTNTEVLRINGVVSGHTSQLSNLTTSIAGKADSSALNALTVRVADEESKSSSQSTSLTNLESSLSNLSAGGRNYVTNGAAENTSRYFTVPLKELIEKAILQNKPIAMSFDLVITQPATAGSKNRIGFETSYTDTSGATRYLGVWASNATSYPVGIHRVRTKYTPPFNTSATISGLTFYNQTGSNVGIVAKNLMVEIGDVHSDFSTAPEDTPDLSGYATSSAMQTLTTEVARVNNVATSAAASTVTLTSRMGNAENALQVQSKVVDGVKASYMVKMETNGVIGGFGLMQSTGVLGQVVTSFGVNANSFFIGAPASKKQPFIVTTTNQVVNGVAYPAGTYIDVALIANATIGTAKIADLAVTGAKIANATIDNAKIANLDAAKINTGTLNAARIGVGSITADKINASVFKSVGADGSSSTISGGTIRAYYPNGKLAFHIGVG